MTQQSYLHQIFFLFLHFHSCKEPTNTPPNSFEKGCRVYPGEAVDRAPCEAETSLQRDGDFVPYVPCFIVASLVWGGLSSTVHICQNQKWQTSNIG
jgi:hypothetical protein